MIVVEKKESGLLGFIINKPLDYEISDVLPEIKMNFPLYNGGPVEQDNLFFIFLELDCVPGPCGRVKALANSFQRDHFINKTT